ncbi:MAG TPA: hypothetical protein VFC19_50310 [Candidatus Limnocylindrales bacterium]|nr:hypothetical protein [Candidatus Limnocylindrales bacterium]
MSLTPPPPVTRRDWTLPIIAGVVAIVVVLGVCLVGSATAFVSLRRQSTLGSGVPVPSAMPTPPSVTGPECLIGDWLETNGVLTVPFGSSELRFSGKGAVTRFSADGSVLVLYQNVVYAASSGSNRYEILNNGSMLLDYEADATTIRYSNPVTLGTSTLKINGTVNTAQPMEASTTPETYTCQGNNLRLQGEQSVTELQRL